ncbi:Mesenchymal stem cell protein DSCD75 [Psychrobacter aquaticus CMS 56]|uniref:Mesenchymal stem cell protein DSCD75 n=1 Tax=Psychrobacter aquaticus CMS 56 TaxID=1354303 RepID=U4TCZ2_9GAMM|nr:Mesenchymal stem cell protein DSCD75 [Psychrobacter aquaticus CMS 56]
MYPFIRYASTIAHAALQVKKGNTLALKETSEIRFRCRLSDIDNFLEMNNGRVFTLYDLGRMDFAVRTGLASSY